jgi:eukaryotic-like serine/threonine-protein kinase
MVMPSNTEIGTWHVCGRELASGMPEGLCPRCLALQVLAEPALASGQSTTVPGFFGDYEVLEEVGRGGTAVVFKARQLGLNRLVALKVLMGGASARREFIYRFHTEAATAAKLIHPGIVPVYEFGDHEGSYFLAMRFMEGGTLRVSPGEPFDPRQAAILLTQIADAVQFAHEHGVLHRDLKPQNILLDGNGKPTVADFGLARILERESDLTLSNAILGTALYLAPEIAFRGASAATTASAPRCRLRRWAFCSSGWGRNPPIREHRHTGSCVQGKF